MMECSMDCLSDYALASFLGTLLALLVTWVLTGRADELRKGVRSLLGGSTRETYTSPDLADYEGAEYPDQDED